jgi:putative ABC transport system substrate-binding protein
MRRREFITLVGGAAAWWPTVARAQADRVRRIGVLTSLDPNDPEGQAEVRSLKQGLQELGWIEGRNLQVEYRWPGSEPVRIQASVTELVGLQCEVIVARSTPVMAALVRETHTIPIVFSYVADPVGSGFIQSFARPGGNVTGFQTYEFTLVGKWLDLLSMVSPSVRRVAYIYNPATAPGGFVRMLDGFVPSIPVQLLAAPVHSASEVDTALLGLTREPGAGLLVVPDIFNDANHAEISSLATQQRLPAIYAHRFDDALISYGPDLPDLFRRAASYVDRILRGEKPSDLPVQAPTKYELIINTKVAKTLGLSVPPALLVAADQVID